MANSQEDDSARRTDMLAAVVLHVLVYETPEAGIDAVGLARACERDPGDLAQASEMDAAVRVLIDDGLATRGGVLLRPTRAAVRAAELSF